MAMVAGPAKTRKLTASIGFHSCKVSETGWILDSWSQLYHPGLVQVFQPGARRWFVHQEMDPLAGWARPTHRLFQVEAEDGTPLHGHVMFPAKVDNIRKAPVLLYVYGGPHSQLVQHRWLGGANLWLYHMASRGYVVVRLDGRGTSGRGIDFAQAIHRGVGEIEVIDQLAALEHIRQNYPFADVDRVGVHGWSYGGYMTLRLMLMAPEQFHVGIAGAPVTDWSQYETGYTERYMDTPQENPEGYASSSVLPYVGNLQGRLMVVHGTDDKTVMWSHAMRFLDACIDQGKPVDFMAYPMQQHGLRGKARAHFSRKMTDYFLEHLPLPEPLPALGAERERPPTVRTYGDR
jgi:dipeptidyl-peptidase-4